MLLVVLVQTGSAIHPQKLVHNFGETRDWHAFDGGTLLQHVKSSTIDPPFKFAPKQNFWAYNRI
jgi:hypothetical protein